MKPTYFEQGQQWHEWLGRAEVAISNGQTQHQFEMANKYDRNIARRAYKAKAAEMLQSEVEASERAAGWDARP